jgi:hypothetical protein
MCGKEMSEELNDTTLLRLWEEGVAEKNKELNETTLVRLLGKVSVLGLQEALGM